MADTLSSLLLAAIPAFPTNSRYHGSVILIREVPGRPPVRHLARRFLPAPASLAEVGEHLVTEGDRWDLVAARRIGDPELSWRLADGNGVLSPEELEVPDTRLRVTLPAGAKGA